MRAVNPIFHTDMPDPDIIRVKDTYYMVSTTMFYMPGAPILKSKDLCHWEIVSYIFDVLEDNEIYRLENGKHAYGKGQWATSLAWREGRFYACFVSHDCGKTYIFSTDDVEKSGWERVELPEVFHDMSFLFWKGGAYLVYGNGTIRIVELREDLGGLKEGGLNQVLFETAKEGMRLRCEGCRAWVRNGYIYLSFIDWPRDGGRRQVCYRSRELLGPYEFRVLMDDDCERPGCGVAQGTIIDDENGKWYGMLFQDRGASGRIPFLMPAGWKDDWPVLGVEGKIPMELELPFAPYEAAPLVRNDSFCHEENRLALQWQWNHNPIPSCWSFTCRPGWLRLITGQLAAGLMDARNTLTQRTMEPGSVCEVTLDSAGMREGDYAGLCALQGRYGQVGVTVRDGERYLFVTVKEEDGEKKAVWRKLDGAAQVRLRIAFDYREGKDEASFAFRLGDGEWESVQEKLHMLFTLDVFVGYRIGLFCYATKELGGYADFTNFTTETMEA